MLCGEKREIKMNKIKIAIWLNRGYAPKEGGGYSYYERLVDAIDNYDFDENIDVCFVTEDENIKGLKREVILLLVKHRSFYNLKQTILLLSLNCHSFYKKYIYKIFSKIPILGDITREWVEKRIINANNQLYRKKLRENSVRAVYYLIQARYKVANFPFIATNWDIGHCSTYAFPELVGSSEQFDKLEFDKRQHYYSSILPRALMVFVESEAGKAELLKYTMIDEMKIKVLPLFAGNCVNLKAEAKVQEQFLLKHGLIQNKFFFYPAQFWAHKNHAGLLQAFAMFLKEEREYKLVLTGSDYGNSSYIRSLASDLNIENSVVFTGFISAEDINTLYCNATALVMATYLGPTNMPPIEAMELDCPVICSDIKGHREILGNSALYFNPMNFIEICAAMKEMNNNRAHYKEALGKQKSGSVFKLEYTMARMNEYLKEAAILLNCWK
jgi:glycosyltransferase involved in cell wall biosynthesis